ncbi:MAG: TonB-dependent receptor [Sulfuricurvum sp.]
MQKSLLWGSVILSMLTMAYADELDTSKDMESLLDNASNVAIKKSLNVDYLPSVVTVIDAQTYRDAGIQTIAEALDMLPGIQMQISPMGYPITTVRGLKTPNSDLSDKMKVLIDGVAVNNEISGSSYFYMDFPMQLVEKIEVLRGPNSTVYGAGAFYGTVNIITKLGSNKKENQLFAGAGSYQYRTVGTNINSASGDWKLFADGYYKQNNKSLDALDSNGVLKQTEEAMKDFSVGFKAINGGFEFLTRLKKSTYGNFYSFDGDLNPIPQRDQDHSDTYFFSQLSYKKTIDDYKLETKANFSHREVDIKGNLFSVADVAGAFQDINITMNDGGYFHEKTQEQNFEVEAILTLPKIKSNDIIVGVGVRQVNIAKDEFYSSIENAITQNLDMNVNYAFDYNRHGELAFWDNPTTKLLKEGVGRTIGYGYAHDLISLSDDVDLILGLRADDYSDYGVQLSKRAGLVYRAADDTILKLLYGSAFRVPTLMEAYGNGHIDFHAGDSTIVPEVTNTYEIQGIYTPNFNHKFSLNLFYAQLNHVIDLEEDQYTIVGYQNFKKRHNKGFEFEYFYHNGLEHDFYFNATRLVTQYTLPAEPGVAAVDMNMPDISKVMLKAMYVYRPMQQFSLGTTWRYFSDTEASKLAWVHGDTTLDATHIFDETATYRFSRNSEARLTGKNIFNRVVTQPSHYYNTNSGIVREGRNWFLSYVYKF